MLEINGVALEFDILDADTAERYESATEAVVKQLGELDLDKMSQAEAIRQECYIVFDYFDAIFGEGTAKTIFGEKTNIGICAAAMEQVSNSAAEQNKAFSDRLTKYRPNRASRRAKA